MRFDKVKIKKDSNTLNFLYRTIPGRVILRILSSRLISIIVGKYMDSPCSVAIIPYFAKKNGIDISLYEEETYHCFNDFFIRRIKSDLRPVDMNDNVLIAPCDGLLSAYKITDGMVIPIKQSEYTIEELVGNSKIANMYKDGICLVFRLCVNHYHRYCYIDSGKKSKNVFIPGQLHTVRPIALNSLPVFTRNCREYTLIKSPGFGTILQMEVGAMFVGKIVNHHSKGVAVRGEEKGYFKYGGSTVVVLIKDKKVVLDDELFDVTDDGYEIPVVYGQKLGKCAES